MKLPAYVYIATSVIVLAAIITPIQAGDTVRLPSSFSYQGQIKQDGLPLTGLVDLKFSLHESPVTVFQIGSTHRADAVEVVSGLFDIQVDFGAEVFNGSAFWLEVRVRTPHDPSDVAPYITLDTRQAITATPYALRSLATEEVSWNDITDVPPGFADDVDHDTLGELTCADGQVPHSNGVDWACADLPVSTGDGHSLDAADGDPIDAVFVGNNGNVGIGTGTPTAKLNVESDANLIQGPVMQSDDVIVESADAVLGLYSDSNGSSGSAISLKEIQQGRLTDHWAIYRESSSAGSKLRLTYGPDKDYESNPAVVEFSSQPGSDSVILPDDAVDSREILDETGIATSFSDGVNPIDLNEAQSSQSLRSFRFRCPADGYIFAVGTAEIQSQFIPGVAPTTKIGLTIGGESGRPLPDNDAYAVTTVGAGAVATITVQNRFSCIAESVNRVHLMGITNAVEGIIVRKNKLTLMFVVSDYRCGGNIFCGP